MVRITLFYLLTGLLFLSCDGSWHPTHAQDFPYSVPRAPEFDHRGNYLGPGSDAPASRPSSQNGAQNREPRNASYHSAVRPYAPQAPVPGQDSATPLQRPQPPRQQRVPAEAATPPEPQAVQQPQMQQRPDCSGYPVALARARSQGEMQMIARQYLTCLMSTGWPQDQARQQVIKTIESTYAVTR